MFRLYQSYRNPLQSRAQAHEVWVERLILEAQEVERRHPLGVEDFRAEIQQAQRYGAERAKAVGMTRRGRTGRPALCRIHIPIACVSSSRPIC